MTVARYATSKITHLHGVTHAATYTYNMAADTQKNMAAVRRHTFTITHLHGVTRAANHTYVTIQHGRRQTDSTNIHTI
jgi:hypothetical protein